MSNFNINLNNSITFNDLSVGSVVYVIDPATATIKETSVFSKRELKRNGRVAVIQFEIYKITGLDEITPEEMDKAHQELNSAVYWRFRIMNTDTVAQVRFPRTLEHNTTFIASDKKELVKFMTNGDKAKSKIILPYGTN